MDKPKKILEEQLTEKILVEDYKEQPFEWETKECGVAEFILCPIISEKKIIEVRLYPVRQPNAKEYFVIKNDNGWEGIHFGTLIRYDKNNKVEQPVVWSTHFCVVHNSHSFRFYVPRGSKAFFITTGLNKFCLNWN